MTGYREGDTICAEATPRGRGGISVVRLSGPDALRIVSALFDKPLPESGRFKFGRIIIRDLEPIPLDDAVVSLFGKPHSYTGEDVVEISTHGSPVIVAELLEALYKAGARSAAPGEFTLRAYLNGQIDLTQAEAVSDIINASSREAVQSAMHQLEGGLGRACEAIAVLVERLLVYAELELDFAEEDVELTSQQEKLRLADEAIGAANAMLAGYQQSRKLREGVKVVLTGVPNVGKSSIYNMLLGEAKAIVHKTPGTTRDVLNAKIVIGGIEFEFFDTAGLRDNPDEVEDEGIVRALQAVREADIIVDVESIDIPGFSNREHQVPVIKITNKCDIKLPEIPDSIAVSAQTGYGFEVLKAKLLDIVTEGVKLTGATINRERHYTALKRGIAALTMGRQGVVETLPGEMIAEEWREALSAFDEITGKKRVDDILITIFSKYCIGK